MTLLGQVSLWLAVILAGWSVIIGIMAGNTRRPELVQSAQRSVYALSALVSVAALSLIVALLRSDFNVLYVASYTSRNLPTVYKISAFYGGQAGSMLFWAFILAIFAAAAQWFTPKRYAYLMPHVGAITSAIILFFGLAMVLTTNPFERLPFTPPDGNGLNPQLQNPGMVIHPPLLYLGYVSISIPFAFAVAALIQGKLDAGWIQAIRRWTILSWLFLSVGITLGMWWAYVELGWGGYWAWDPVENASFLPWLTMTAFLHSVMVQEKRGMLKKWNVVLVALSFMLSIFGTFITRSGIISSVHSFAQSSVGYYFVGFLLLAGAGIAWLFWRRWDMLQAEERLESMVSREASFLFNNLLLLGMAFAVFWGTIFPIVSELVKGTKVAVGPPFFNQVNIPIGLGLLALTGIGPLIAWRKASTRNLKRQFTGPVASGALVGLFLVAIGFSDFYSGVAISLAAFVVGTVVQEFVRGVGARHRLHGENYAVAFGRLVARNRRRYGGYIVHLGIVTYFVAFTGQAFRTEMEVNLEPGESIEMRSPFGHTYSFTHLGLSEYTSLNRYVLAASVDVARDGERVGVMTSERRQYVDSFNRPTFQPATEAGITSLLREDIYVVYAGSNPGTEDAIYRFTINPLVWWVWFGGFILVVGGMVSMWPSARGPLGSQVRRRAVSEGYRVTLSTRGA